MMPFGEIYYVCNWTLNKILLGETIGNYIYVIKLLDWGKLPEKDGDIALAAAVRLRSLSAERLFLAEPLPFFKRGILKVQLQVQ